MDYTVGDALLHNSSFKITEAEFVEIVAACRIVSTARDIAIGLDVFCRAVVDYEQLLMSRTFEGWFTPEAYDAQEFWDRTRSEVNLRLLAVLTSYYTFEKSTEKTLSALGKTGGPVLLQEFRNQLRKAFDESLPYRIAVMMRNLAQHERMPVSSTARSSRRLAKGNHHEIDSPFRSRHRLDVSISVKDLISNGDFKPKICGELRALGSNWINVTYVIRQFTADLLAAHQRFNHKFLPLLSNSLEKISEVVERAKLETGNGTSHWEARKTLKGSNEDHYMNVVQFQTLKQSLIKWQVLGKLRFGFVSTELVLDDGMYPTEPSPLWMDEE